MEFFDRLLVETKAERTAFLTIPVLQRALHEGVDIGLYLGFLGQAYQHVKHTVPLLSLAMSHCRPADTVYREALQCYIAEETGHDEWILDDIRALGGDADSVRAALPGLPCRLMLAYAYYAIQHIDPYALLGMVHVLEGMSVALAQLGADAVRRRLAVDGDAGFRYLTSHGALDQDHVAMFRNLVNRIGDRAAQQHIIDTVKLMYGLYGDIFRALDGGMARGESHAA